VARSFLRVATARKGQPLGGRSTLLQHLVDRPLVIDVRSIADCPNGAVQGDKEVGSTGPVSKPKPRKGSSRDGLHKPEMGNPERGVESRLRQRGRSPRIGPARPTARFSLSPVPFTAQHISRIYGLPKPVSTWRLT
jgi:hypothetical protein